jgi:hypothetical protein
VCPAEIDDEIRSLSPEQRRQYRLYAGHYKYDVIREHFADAIWLTLIRNPVDRVVSNYFNLRDPDRYVTAWIRRARERPKVQRFLDKVQSMTLEEFVFSEEKRARDRVVNRQTRYLVPRELKRRNPFPLHDESLLETAKRNLRERFAFVGVQEDFGLALDLFLMTFGLPPLEDPDRFSTNINTREKTRRGYEISDEVRRHLEDHNRMDLELWAYAREIMFERLKAFQDFFIERDYVLRKEGCAGLPPGAAAVETLRPRPGSAIMRRLKQRVPTRIKRLIRSTVERAP